MALPLNHDSEAVKLVLSQLETERLQRAATMGRRRVVAWRLEQMRQRAKFPRG